MAVLGQADEARLGGGGTVGQRKHGAGGDALRFEQRAHAVAGIVQTDDAAAMHLEAKFGQVGGHAASAAHAILVVVLAQDGYGGLRADPLGVAVDIAVENQVADQHHALAAEGLNQFDEAGDHG